MKKAMAMAIAVCSVFGAAQVFAKEITEGTLAISGSSSGGLNGNASQYNVSDGRTDSYATTEFGFSTRVDYFVSSRLAIGLVGSIGKYSEIYHNNLSPGDITHKETNYGIGPSVTLHTPLSPSLNTFLSAFVALSHREYTETGASPFSNEGAYGGISLGLANFIGENAAINTAIYYQVRSMHAKYGSGTTYEYSSGQLGLGLGLSIYIQ